MKDLLLKTVSNSEILASIEETQLLKRILQLRLAIRQKKVKNYHIFTLLNLKSIISKPLWDIWSGEIYILVAFAFADLNDHSKSNVYNQFAIESLSHVGANKKKLRAMHNYIASLSSINSEKRHISDYLFIYKEAFKLKVFDLAGLALANIAREFQILGIFRLADRISIKSYKLAAHNSSSLHHYLICLYRAHILLDLNKLTDATDLIEYCKKSPFYEIRGAVLILEGIIRKTYPSKLKLIKNSAISPEWLERLKIETGRGSKKITMTPMEEKLILFLSFKERSKKSIISHLYGNRIDFEYVQNRFYVLISRIHKKIPNLIHTKGNSMYFIK